MTDTRFLIGFTIIVGRKLADAGPFGTMRIDEVIDIKRKKETFERFELISFLFYSLSLATKPIAKVGMVGLA